jgi:hypothetical protein
MKITLKMIEEKLAAFLTVDDDPAFGGCTAEDAKAVAATFIKTITASIEVEAAEERVQAAQEATYPELNRQVARTIDPGFLPGFVRGDQVVVARGRKVPIGTTGELFWAKEGQYGWRVGVRDADGEAHWTAAKNIDKVAEAA